MGTQDSLHSRTNDPNAEQIALIEDNLGTHKKADLYKVFETSRACAIIQRIEFVYTLKHGSWLNIAKCELSVLSKQVLDARIDSKATWEKYVKVWAKDRNNAQNRDITR